MERTDQLVKDKISEALKRFRISLPNGHRSRTCQVCFCGVGPEGTGSTDNEILSRCRGFQRYRGSRVVKQVSNTECILAKENSLARFLKEIDSGVGSDYPSSE